MFNTCSVTNVVIPNRLDGRGEKKKKEKGKKKKNTHAQNATTLLSICLISPPTETSGPLERDKKSSAMLFLRYLSLLAPSFAHSSCGKEGEGREKFANLFL